MGEDNLSTSITVDDLGEPTLSYTSTWSSVHYISPTQQYYNALCNAYSVNTEIDEESWKEIHKIIKQQEKQEEKRKLIENFHELTKILEKNYNYSIPF